MSLRLHIPCYRELPSDQVNAYVELQGQIHLRPHREYTPIELAGYSGKMIDSVEIQTFYSMASSA